jgi:hypothetical protein
MKLIITQDSVNAITNYLTKQPWAEANQLIIMLQKCKPAINGENSEMGNDQDNVSTLNKK